MESVGQEFVELLQDGEVDPTLICFHLGQALEDTCWIFYALRQELPHVAMQDRINHLGDALREIYHCLHLGEPSWNEFISYHADEALTNS
jgi:hypothetical protein